MHSSDHRMPASHCALKCISEKNIVRVRQILSHRKRTRFWACCPYSVRASLQSSSRGNLVLNGGSNATWSLRPKNTLRASHFRLLAIVSYCRLHNASTFGSRLATRADVKRPTMVANGEKQMFRAQSESGAVSGFHVGGSLVGSWTLDLEPPVKRNVVPTGSRAESLERHAIGPAVHETLILVWTLR